MPKGIGYGKIARAVDRPRSGGQKKSTGKIVKVSEQSLAERAGNPNFVPAKQKMSVMGGIRSLPEVLAAASKKAKAAKKVR